MEFPSERAARAAMVEVGRRLHARGLVNGGEGNLSCRLAPRLLLCTPTGVNQGFLTEEMLEGVARVQLLASFKRPVAPLPEAECRILAEQRRAAQEKGR